MYVEGESDVRTKLVRFFSRWRNSTGDLALWWKVARERRLGRQVIFLMSRPEKTRAMKKYFVFPVGGDRVNPRYWCSPL